MSGGNELLAEKHYQFLPVGEAVSPVKGGTYEHYVNRWWTVHPEKGLAFYNPLNERTGRRRRASIGAPQCNASEAIARMVAENIYDWPHELKFMESAWVPIDLSDWVAS